MRRAVLIGIAAGILASCGAREVVLDGAAVGIPVSQAVASGRPAEPAQAAVSDAGTRRGASPHDAVTPVDETQRFGELLLTVTISPACATPGMTLRATITTTPGSAVALAVSYSDHQTYGQYGTFRVTPAGTLIYPWSVPAVAPAGPGRLLLGVTDEARGQSAGGVWPFEVASVVPGCGGAR